MSEVRKNESVCFEAEAQRLADSLDRRRALYRRARQIRVERVRERLAPYAGLRLQPIADRSVSKMTSVPSGMTTCDGIQNVGCGDLSTGMQPSKRGSEVSGQSSVSSTKPRADKSSTATPPSTTSHCGPNSSESMSWPETAPSTSATSRPVNSRTHGSEGELIQHMRTSCGCCGDRHGSALRVGLGLLGVGLGLSVANLVWWLAGGAAFSGLGLASFVLLGAGAVVALLGEEGRL